MGKVKKTPGKEIQVETNGEFTKPLDLHARISNAAYMLFTQSGFTHGNDKQNWMRAEKAVNKKEAEDIATEQRI